MQGSRSDGRDDQVSSNRRRADIGASSKRWNPTLQRVESSYQQRGPGQSAVPGKDNGSKSLENSSNSDLEASRSGSSFHRRTYDEYRPTYNLPSNDIGTSAVSPPPARRDRDSCRPVYKEVRPSASYKQLVFGARPTSTVIDGCGQGLQSNEQGLKIKGLASTSKVPASAAVTAGAKDPFRPRKAGDIPLLPIPQITLDRLPNCDGCKDSNADCSRYVPCQACDRDNLDCIYTSTNDLAKGPYHSNAVNASDGVRSASEKEKNCTKSTLLNAPATGDTNRLAVASLPVVPAFRKGGTPGSEITTSSKASYTKLMCRNCGGGQEPLHPLVKCQTCARRFHQSCLDSAMRIEGDSTRFMCSKCVRRSNQHELPARSPSQLTREAPAEVEDDWITRLKKEGQPFCMTSIPQSHGAMHVSPPRRPPTEPAAGRNADQPFQDLWLLQHSQNHTPQAPQGDTKSLLSETLLSTAHCSARDEKDCFLALSSGNRNRFNNRKDFAKRYKEVTCPWWDRDDCFHHESACIFAHQPTYIRVPSGQELNKDWTCWFWWNSVFCPYYDRQGGCLYEHFDTGLYVGIDGRECRKYETCFWWNKNRRCKKDTACPYAHYETGRLSQDPSKKPGGTNFQPPTRSSQLQFHRQASASGSGSGSNTLIFESQQMKDSTTPATDDGDKTADPRSVCARSELNFQIQSGDRDGPKGESLVVSTDDIRVGTGNASPTVKYNKCNLCDKRIWGADRCASCQSTEELVPAESSVVADDTDLSTLVSNELGIEDSENDLDNTVRPTSLTNEKQTSAKVIKRKAALNERFFRPNKRQKPNVNVADICGRVKPPPNLEGSLQTSLKLQKFEGMAVRDTLASSEALIEVTEITDLPNTKVVPPQPQTPPYRPPFSPLTESHSNREVPALSVETSLVLDLEDINVEKSPPAEKEKTSLWSQTTVESEDDEDCLSVGDLTRDLPLTAWVKPPVSAVPKKVACADCHRRHRRCEHNVDVSSGDRPDPEQLVTYKISRQKQQDHVEKLIDECSRENSVRSDTATSRSSNASISTDTPASSVAPSVSGVNASEKFAVLNQQDHVSVEPEICDDHESEEAVDEDKSLEGIIRRMRDQGIVVESDDSEDDSEDDVLPQRSDLPPSNKFKDIWRPPITYGQGMKNQDKRAVLRRGMIFNQQIFGNKHYSRKFETKQVQVKSVFEKKIYSTKNKFAVPKVQETWEQASFAEYLGLPQDFEPEPTLGPGEGNTRELHMKNRDVNEQTGGNSRKRRVKGNETWPIRGE